MGDFRASVAGYRWLLPCTGLYWLALSLVYWSTLQSMVTIWFRSDTFAHGVLIAPISIWLIWRKREQLAAAVPRLDPLIALLLVPLGLVWLLAWLVSVQVVQQLASVAMLVVGTAAILGRGVTGIILFPLLFLFFAVPMGEALIPPMMEFTATSTVWLIQASRVPVYREGLYFMLPSGNWSVVEACSGVRYLIASVTLGVLYAYLTYQSAWRRILFVLAALLVPIAANTLRAYIIVMLGHLSDMKLATGVDHLIYGWIFFGLVMLLLFWVGALFGEDEVAEEASPLAPGAAAQSFGKRKLPASALWLSVVFALALCWAGIAGVVAERGSGEVAMVDYQPPVPQGDWRSADEVAWSWRPIANGGYTVEAAYQSDGVPVGLYLNLGRQQVDVIDGLHRLVLPKDDWRVMERKHLSARVNQEQVVVQQAMLDGVRQRVLVWSWYWVAGQHTSNEIRAKLLEALVRLGVYQGAPVRLALVVLTDEDQRAAQVVLQQFLDDHAAELGPGFLASEGRP